MGQEDCSLCYTGWEPSGESPFTCVDIDECELEIDICDQNCSNTDGHYDCSCDDGYEVSGEQDEHCTENICTCSHGD
eukprot:UN26844